MLRPRRFLRAALLLVAGYSLAFAEPSKLLVLSIGGLDARYLHDADRLRLKIPNLRKLMAHGAVAEVTGVLPGGTWPADTSLVTGVPPSQHAVLDGPGAPGLPKVLTLWQAAARARIKTAMVYWPATAGAEAEYNCPDLVNGDPETQVQFDPISEKCTPGLVTRIASVYPAFTKSMWNDSSVADALRYLLEYEQPRLVLAHFSELETEQHGTGALSIYAREVLENQDEMLGQILAKAPAHMVVAIVSDHGFETEEHTVRPRVLLRTPGIEVRNGLIGATDAKAAAGMRGLMLNKKNGIAREVPMSEVRLTSPELRGWTAAFLTAQGYVASDAVKGPGVGPGNHKGVHELWPGRPGYRAVFLLSGGNVRPARLPDISMLDVAPTLAEILDLRLPAAKGKSLWPRLHPVK